MCLAIPGRVSETFSDGAVPMAKVDFGGLAKTVCVAHVPHARVGDYVLVHVGFALSVIDEAEARRTFALLDELQMLGDLAS
jgi:hydrogenase expression/formation protein HypC